MGLSLVNLAYETYLFPTTSPDDWRYLLAEPEKQWRSGYSAKELAECWERADGFPPEVKALFAHSANPALLELELLLAIPEYKVELPGGSHASQNNLFVLARASDGHLVAIMVEGKVAEPFGDPLGKWLKDSSRGKQTLLKFLCDTLCLTKEPPAEIRYQLLHRTASAILTARHFNAGYALMIVHSFSQDHLWFEDYQAFLKLFGVTGKVNELVELPGHASPRVYAGWVVGK